MNMRKKEKRKYKIMFDYKSIYKKIPKYCNISRNARC